MKKNTPVITAGLVAINILVFLIMEYMGDTYNTIFLYEYGAMYVPSVLEKGEWYRVISHMFVHSGMEHLINNMFMLAVVGCDVEKVIGKFKYIIGYFVCGIGATIVSALAEISSGSYAVGVGASGAITGIFAIYIVIAIKNSGRFKKQQSIRMLIVLGLLVFGNMEAGIDWQAHLGGAVTGILIGLVMYRKKRKVEDYG